MARKKQQEKEVPSLDKVIDKKLCLYITVVNDGYADAVSEVFKSKGANAQYIEKGRGTAQREIRDILGIEENSKEIVFSMVTSDKAVDVKNALSAIFMTNKKMQGIAFSISLTSIIGVKVYQCLADIIKEN